jgi:hypothetical protein
LGVLPLESRVTPSAPIPVGPEFQVNTTTAANQVFPQTAMDAEGNSVIVWKSDADIYAQRIDQSGLPLAGEIHVNPFTPSVGADLHSVAMDAQGNFVVVFLVDSPGGDFWQLRGQRFDSAGLPVGGVFAVNPATQVWVGWPDVAMDAAGNFVITWHVVEGENDVYARRYNVDGQALGEAFRVNTLIEDTQYLSSVAMNADGEFVVAWKDRSANPGEELKARCYSPDGNPVSSEIVVAQGEEPGLIGDVAIDAAGNFVVTWYQGASAFARRFTSLGQPAGTEFQVTTFPVAFEPPSVAMSPNGSFVITWFEDNQIVTGDVYAQAFDSLGRPISTEMRVNTYTADFQGYPAIAMNPAGNFVVAWISHPGQDGDGAGIFAQRYRPGVPQVQSTRINDGAAQRSRVTSLTVTFDTVVTFESGVGKAFTLIRNGGKPVSFKASSSVVDGLTIVTLTDFTGGSTQVGSLADGRYTLTALSSQITDAFGQNLDGDNNGQAGGNYTFGDAQGLFRMFGDVNGDRQVDGFDFGALSFAYSSLANQPNYLWFLDVNGDGQIDGFDLSQFSGRYNTVLP